MPKPKTMMMKDHRINFSPWPLRKSSLDPPGKPAAKKEKKHFLGNRSFDACRNQLSEPVETVEILVETC